MTTGAAAEENAAIFERDAAYYTRVWALQKPERVLLKRFKDRWPQTDMLDLGVGAGRTAYTFAALTRSYIGVDYSPSMIGLCRSLIGEDESTRFLVCDARDLSQFHGANFRFVLFSFNGIDYVGHEDRLRILREIRRVIADDGFLAFSSHSLATLPFRLRVARPSARHPSRSAHELWRTGKRAAKYQLQNRQIDLPRARTRGWALLRDEAHDFGVVTYYVEPGYQVSQLEDAGFTSRDVYNMSGCAVDPAQPGRDAYLYYLCRPSGEPKPPTSGRT